MFGFVTCSNARFVRTDPSLCWEDDVLAARGLRSLACVSLYDLDNSECVLKVSLLVYQTSALSHCFF